MQARMLYHTKPLDVMTLYLHCTYYVMTFYNDSCTALNYTGGVQIF